MREQGQAFGVCLADKAPKGCKVKVTRLYPPNETSLAGCEPPMRFEPRTHRLQGWTANFLSQVPRRLLDCPERIKGCKGHKEKALSQEVQMLACS